MSEVFVEVGQHSRESARVPVDVLSERLEGERKKLLGEKQKIEATLCEISRKKADRLAGVYRRRMNKSESIAATNEIQSDFNNERSQLLRDKAAVEERLHDIKRKLSSTADVREDVKVLLRIELLLGQILSKISAVQQ